MKDTPEEDKWIIGPRIDLNKLKCRPGEHDYVDLYAGWGYADEEQTKLISWVFCKKCLDKKKLFFDMSDILW